MMARGGWMLSFVGLLIASGCGTSPEKFHDDYLESYCSYASDCHMYESADACADAYVDWAPDDACFDAGAATDCIKALDEAACPTSESPVEFPDACNAVYTCVSGE
jgi:hypothetical protein